MSAATWAVASILAGAARANDAALDTGSDLGRGSELRESALPELPLPLATFAGRSVAVGWAGEVHLVGRRADWAARKLVADGDVAQLVYLRLDGDTWTQEPIPPPPSLGESWGADTFVDASVAIDGDGWPMIAFTQDWQPGPGESQTSVFLARRGPDGWRTTELESFAGQLSSLTLATYEGRWCLAALFASEGFGVVRWGPGEGPVVWARTGVFASHLALVEGGSEPRAVYRALDDVRLVHPDGETERIAGDAAWQVSAVAAGDAVHLLKYDPNRERPYVRVAARLDADPAGADPTADPAGADPTAEPAADPASDPAADLADLAGADLGADPAAHAAEADLPGSDPARLDAVAADRAAETPLDVKEAGWNNTAALAPDGTPLLAWYYRRNAFNKGVVVARLGEDGKTWESWTQLRDPKDNVGLYPTLSVGDDGTVVLAALNRSTNRLEVHRYASVDEAREAAIPPAGDWTDRHRSTELFTYGGGWFQTWRVQGGADDTDLWAEGVTPMEGTLALRPALGIQGGLAGRIGRFDLALEYLKRNGGELADTVDKLENLAGKVGIDKFPFPGSSAQVHFHSVDLSGAYQKPDGSVVPATLSERDLQVRYLGKGDYYVGLGYRAVRSPQDLYQVQWGGEDQPDTVLASWDTIGRIGTTTVFIGRSAIDYLGRYEIGHLGPYFDLQVGCGYAAGRFVAGDQVLKASAFAGGGRADVGLVAYRRLRELRGAGVFLQAGVRGDGTMMFTFPGEQGTTALQFQRTEGRAGPFANAGAVF